jgi:hypothetical protein
MGKPGEGVGAVDERVDTDEPLLAGARGAALPPSAPSPGDGESAHPPGHHAPTAAAPEEPAEGAGPAVRREPSEEG